MPRAGVFPPRRATLLLRTLQMKTFFLLLASNVFMTSAWYGQLKWKIFEGKALWTVLTGDDVRGGAALGADGTIYIGSDDKNLYAIAPTGQVKWKLAAADRIHSTPGIASDGTILFGSEDEHVYAVAPDGTLRWHIQLAGDVDTTPAIAADGTLYVAGDDGHLHAFR